MHTWGCIAILDKCLPALGLVHMVPLLLLTLLASAALLSTWLRLSVALAIILSWPIGPSAVVGLPILVATFSLRGAIVGCFLSTPIALQTFKDTWTGLALLSTEINLCVLVCVYLCMYVCMHVCACMYVSVCLYMNMYIYMYVCVYVVYAYVCFIDFCNSLLCPLAAVCLWPLWGYYSFSPNALS